MRKTMPPSSALLQRLLAGMAAVVAMSLIAALLTAVLLFGMIYLTYELLVANGLDAHAAIITVGVIVLLLVAGLLLAVRNCLRSIRDIPKRLLHRESSIGHKVHNIADAFMDGFMKEPAHH